MKDQTQIEQLLEEYYLGNDATIEAFFLHFGDRLVGLAQAILNDSGRAKDVVQDVMIKLIETPTELRREKFRPNAGNVLGALKMRVRNRSIDLIRQRSRQKEVDIQTLFDLEGGESAIGQFTLGNELSIAIQVLDPLEKRVLQSHLDGYTNPEIEEIFPLDNTARVIKQRIKRKLKREILRLRNNN